MKSPRFAIFFALMLAVFASGGFGLDVGPRCGGSQERPLPPQQSQADWLMPEAHADIAPGPEDPCYRVKEGGSCVSSDGEPGTCEQSCYDQRNPATGEVMYQKCHLHCRGQSHAPAKSETPKAEKSKS